jgi:hypothetical protein
MSINMPWLIAERPKIAISVGFGTIISSITLANQ